MEEMKRQVSIMQIRFKTVKNWFNRGNTQHALLYLHRKRPDSRLSEAIQVARWRELTSVSEKIIIAQAVNSTLAKMRPITEAEG
jgi:hypothetical protein